LGGKKETRRKGGPPARIKDYSNRGEKGRWISPLYKGEKREARRHDLGLGGKKKFSQGGGEKRLFVRKEAIKKKGKSPKHS